MVNVGDADLGTIKALRRLYGALKSGILGKPVPDRALRAALAGAPFDPSRLEAEELLRKARLAFASLKRTAAINLLNRAESLYLRHIPLTVAKKGLETTWTYLLLNLHDMGLRARARSVARALSALTRGSKPAGIPVPTWKQYRPMARLRQIVRTLTIVAPAGASVFVDFRKVKPPPTKPPSSVRHAAGVDAGEHHVTVEAKGRRRFYLKVPGGRASQVVHAVLPTAPVDALQALRTALSRVRTLAGPPRRKAVAALATAHGLSRVLAAKTGPAHLTVRLLDVRTATYLGPSIRLGLPIDPSGFASLRKWTIRVRAAVTKAVADTESAPARPKKLQPREAARKAAREVTDKKKPLSKSKKTKPLWKQWYFWVAAAAVATVITVFALRKDEGNTVEVRVTRP